MTGADDKGTRDRAADYKGEGGERAANNNGIRAHRAESVKKERNQVYAKKTFSATRSVRFDFLLPPKHPMSGFRFISLILSLSLDIC
jgi:hypothetical protein